MQQWNWIFPTEKCGTNLTFQYCVFGSSNLTPLVPHFPVLYCPVPHFQRALSHSLAHVFGKKRIKSSEKIMGDLSLNKEVATKFRKSSAVSKSLVSAVSGGAFSAAVPQIWNSLPDDVISTKSISTLKAFLTLHRYMFRLFCVTLCCETILDIKLVFY